MESTHRKLDLWALEDVPPEDWHTAWPEGSREMLLDVLRDEHATDSELYIAGTLLCRMPRIDDRWVEDLLSIVQHDDITEQTRARAAIPLGPLLATAHIEGFDSGGAPVEEAVFHRARNVLYDIHADPGAPSLLRRRALETFAHAPEERLADAIRTAYADDHDWQVTALRCMFYHDGFEKEILESLDSKNIDIRSAAIRAAGPCDLQEAWPYIRAVLSEPSSAHKPLLLAAIGSIGHIRPERAEDLLRDLVLSDDEDIARAAKQALAFVLWPLANCKLGDDAPYH